MTNKELDNCLELVKSFDLTKPIYKSDWTKCIHVCDSIHLMSDRSSCSSFDYSLLDKLN